MHVHVVVITHRAGSFGVAGMVTYNVIHVNHHKGRLLLTLLHTVLMIGRRLYPIVFGYNIFTPRLEQ